MFKKAKTQMDESVVRVFTDKSQEAGWKDFVANLSKGNLIQAPYCNTPSCEDQIKTLSAAGLDVEEGAPSMGAKALCMPFKPLDELKGFCLNIKIRFSFLFVVLTKKIIIRTTKRFAS